MNYLLMKNGKPIICKKIVGDFCIGCDGVRIPIKGGTYHKTNRECPSPANALKKRQPKTPKWSPGDISKKGAKNKVLPIVKTKMDQK